MLNVLSDDEKMLAAGYVLGDLTPEEVASLERLLTEKSSVVKEIHALQASYELIPQSLSIISPPAHVRAKIAAASKSGVDTPQLKPARFVWKILFGLATLGALLLAADNFRLRYRLAQEAPTDQIAEEASTDQVAEEVPTDRVASILQQPNSRLISLTSSESEAAGTLLFTPGNWKEVIVSLGDLPPLPPEQVYRMWLELENGEVIYCGEFNTDADGSVYVRFTPSETPPKGVKTTQLFVTVDASETSPSSEGERVMQGII